MAKTPRPAVLLSLTLLGGCDLFEEVGDAFGKWEPESRTELQELISDRVPTLLETTQTPGVVVVLVEDGAVVWGKAMGDADPDAGTAMTVETTWFQAASISKSVTAWVVASLVDDGELDWFTPVNPELTRWSFPDSEYDVDAITVEQLLRHRGGTSVGGYTGVYVEGDTLPSLEESLLGTAASLDLPVEVDSEPGTFRYSGGGFTVLQLLVEETTGQTFEDYAQERVFDPLGVDLTFLPDEVGSELAIGHSRGATAYPNYLYTEKAAAGVYATPVALADLATAWMGDDRGWGVLSPEIVDAMVQYRLGIFEADDVEYYYHTGDNVGWATLYAFHPATGDGLVVLTNGDGGDLVYPEILEGWEYLQGRSR